MSIALSLLIALLLDYFLKEPKRFHPLVGFGNLAIAIEKRLNQGTAATNSQKRAGIIAWLLAVIPLSCIALIIDLLLSGSAVFSAVVGGVVLYLAIGWQSLLSHALAIAKPLNQGDLDSARTAVGMIVSRDTSELDEKAVASAATESVLENGADAIFAAIFWFCLLGIPGVVLYRLSNTLDAMWGYKNERFLHFGWCAARIDDLLNFIPARLTALSYALVGETKIALDSWKQQAPTWKSPNAGPVMAAGAGAINVSLGGAAIYHGEVQQRPPLGPVGGDQPSAKSIEDACGLVNRVLMLWGIGLYVTLALTAAITSGVSS
ncbi:adenosylcobinamide-phosphate synthase CbiB [Neptuniibacter sp. SY11_33]|uniref:adenosylcobinamide-phosphate synthase CbiB n=1 Tax=Neptuniibacter sp. SY11_33 TaxID=3398215 RepID=UPI0039F51C8C